MVDADALNQLALKSSVRKNWVLTPHVAEAARLLNCSASEIQNDRTLAARQLQNRYQGIVLLKGAGTLIVEDTQEIQCCIAGNPAMATAGMGDILTGVIAALIAQGLPLDKAAALGALAHATAADKLSKTANIVRGMIARDLLKGIQECLNP